MSIRLGALRRGERAVLTRVDSCGGGQCSALQERMAAMGFVPGTELEVEANYGRGPVIVRIRGACVALGRGQANKLMVRPVIAEAAANSAAGGGAVGR
jgi:Fe2+ transport system protein FeoA